MKASIISISLLALVIINACICFWASADNFWIDEVSTYYLAMDLATPMEAITRVRSDHHILNTMYMSALGDQSYWGVYRLLSVISGITALLLLSRDAAQRTLRQRFLVILLAGLSYPLIHYASEARGYAPAICFSIAAFILLQEGWRKPRLILRLFFWIFSILALLAHITTLYPLLGMSAWSLYRVVSAWKSDRDKARKEAGDCILTYLPPYAAMMSIYFFIMRESSSIGGDIHPLKDVLLETLAYWAGSPVTGIWAVVGAVVAVIVIILSLRHIYRLDLGRFLFYLCTIVVAPALALIVYQREYLYPRYFILCFPFAFLLVSEWLDHLWSSAGKARITAIAMISLFLIGNGIHITKFLKYGRGGYYEAVRSAYQASHLGQLTISSDHDFRVGMMIRYYARYFPATTPFRYIPLQHLPTEGTQWFITHSSARTVTSPASISIGDLEYRRIKDYPYYGLSGMHWTLYARATQQN